MPLNGTKFFEEIGERDVDMMFLVGDETKTSHIRGKRVFNDVPGVWSARSPPGVEDEEEGNGIDEAK